MILRHLRDGTDELIGSVSARGVQPTGDDARVHGVDHGARRERIAHRFRSATGRTACSTTSRADYARLTWDDSGTALAVLRGMDRRGFTEKENSLIAFDKAWRASRRRSCSGASS